MTITQLEYIVALDTYKSFVLASEKCFVTQPTLSMQVQKLEEELGVKLFDRKKQPIKTTTIGHEILTIARSIIQQSHAIKNLVAENKGEIVGQLKLGVIPTLAPYLIPLFVTNFIDKYPKVKLTIIELTTDQIIQNIKNETIDCALLVTPLHEKYIKEIPLFYEPFVAYVSKKSKLYKLKQINTEDIDLAETLVLNEGHCFRNQVLSLCNRQTSSLAEKPWVEYETGSLETFKRLIEKGQGVTILPELAITDFNAKQTAMLRYFKTPEPVREVSLITHTDYYKKNIIEALKQEIAAVIPQKMLIKQHKNIINIK
jgi:LysR family hydrogen peroxide-inducible transcriptional activator